MNKKNIMLTFIIVSFFFFQPTLSIALEQKTENTSYDSHLIENISYSYQKEIHYCELACFEMVLKYYGYNFTQTELLYFTGGGYSFGYKPTLESIVTPPRIAIANQVQLWTDELTSGTDDLKLISELLGLNFRYIYPNKVVNHEKEWQNYWDLLKGYISKDVPVITGVDPIAWLPYLESVNISFILPKMFASSHIVVVVGFNEENNTVCVNDPCTGYFGFPEAGVYRWVDIDEFKKAVGRMRWPVKECRYQLLIFENNTKPVFSEEYIHEVIHNRNIQKSIGSLSAYDGDFTNEVFTYYGISALEEFRDDVKYKASQRILVHKLLLKTNILYLFSNSIDLLNKKSICESLNKRYLSIFLDENKELNPYYEKESLLFLSESRCWENITEISEALIEVVNNNTMFKSMILSKPLFSEIVNHLDNIIAIRKLIIDENML